eukprot:1738026-Rhodomonas_salina.2
MRGGFCHRRTCRGPSGCPTAVRAGTMGHRCHRGRPCLSSREVPRQMVWARPAAFAPRQHTVYRPWRSAI